MKNIDATYAMELVHMDYLTVEVNESGKDVNILVIMDHFMPYAQAIVTSLQTVKCTAQNLWNNFTVHYGLPEKILTDQVCNFKSDLLRELCKLAQVKKIRTMGYHPQTEMPKSTWREQAPMLVCPYNCTRNNMTDFSLYYLMFGRKQHLPTDIIFDTNTAELKDNTSTKYVENLKQRLEWVYKTTNEVVKKEQK